MDIKSLLETFSTWLDKGGWLGELFLVVVAVVAVNFILVRVLNYLKKRTDKTVNIWDDALINSLSAPLKLFVWVIGLGIAAEFAQLEKIVENGDSMLEATVDPARRVAIVLVIGWFLLRLVTNVRDNIISTHVAQGDLDHTAVDAVSKLLRISVFITVALVIMQTLGFSISGVLAFGGVGGLAVGLAAKDLLQNLFGGLTVYMDRPFKVGDWIRSPEKDIQGVVEEIGWRRTVVRGFDKRPLYVPNAMFTTIIVENPSRMTHRRINETIGLRYDDFEQVPVILQEVKSLLKAHEGIDQNQICMVNFNEFSSHSLDFFIYCLTITREWAVYHEVKQDILFKIGGIVERHGAEIAFPTTTLHVPEMVTIRNETS